jgi:hypothetical protein
VIRKALPLAGLLYLLSPLVALAQGPPLQGSQSIDDIRKDYTIHLGGLYLKPSAQLKELGVDTNVFNESENPRTDFTFTLTPKALLAVPIARRALLTGTAAVDAVYYQRFATERSFNPQFTLRQEGYAHRLTVFAEEAYLNTHQRANDELDVRVRRTERALGGGAAVRLTPKFSIEAAARGSAIRFDSHAVFRGQLLEDTLDDDARTYSLTARQQLTALTTLSLVYERQHDLFSRDPIRNADSFRIMPGVDFKPRALISGTAHVGYRSFEPTSGLVPPANGLVAKVALSYVLLGDTIFGVTYDRDFQFSYNASTPYYVQNSPGLFVRRAVGEHFDVIANVSRSTYDYRELLASPTSAPVAVPVETTDGYGLNLGYRLRRQTRVGVGVSYLTRASTTDLSRAYTGFRFATTVSSGLTR